MKRLPEECWQRYMCIWSSRDYCYMDAGQTDCDECRHYKKGKVFMKNTLGDLNMHLFAQLERLSDEDLKGEALQEEINRAKAVNSVAAQIIANGNLVLDAKKAASEYVEKENMPKMLEG